MSAVGSGCGDHRWGEIAPRHCHAPDDERVSGADRKGFTVRAVALVKDDQPDHSADLPWHELWDRYQREAQRFSDRDLGKIIGEESARQWQFDGLPDDGKPWDDNHYLVVGEFLRRHHARLAHEIAHFGYPGLEVGNGVGQFPALAAQLGNSATDHRLRPLADLIGLTARSHGTSLRLCQDYVSHYPKFGGSLKPMDSAVLYPMALLRVADYLQIDRQRAPAVLLQLRDPQSPVSIREWAKHLAVEGIGPDKDNPSGVRVIVNDQLDLEVYLQLRDLLAGLQHEMDQSTAVLDEVYGGQSASGLDRLCLKTRRVYSNLDNADFRRSLPYVPERTGFAADPNLLTLLVEPLYGKEPGVGVRELMQNAVDAVRELDAWCKSRDKSPADLDLPDLDGDADVLIDFIEGDDDRWTVRVQDRGIGMTADTLQNYFLRAGASFRRSSDWAEEFLDDDGKPRVIRAGRFGIGVFAVFLLGDTFKLSTRHVTADKLSGYSMTASADSQLIEITRTEDLPVGTTIEVELSAETMRAIRGRQNDVQSGLLNFVWSDADWFCWNWPIVRKRIVDKSSSESALQRSNCPIHKNDFNENMAMIHPSGFKSVFWRLAGDKWPDLSVNGLSIGHPGHNRSAAYEWPQKEVQLERPAIAVVDSVASLSLTTQRYRLTNDEVPFIDELTRDVTLSFIAHALFRGPTSRKNVSALGGRHPLSLPMISSSVSIGNLRWCTSDVSFVPADPWLLSLLNNTTFLLRGAVDDSYRVLHNASIFFEASVVSASRTVIDWCIDSDHQSSGHGLADMFSTIVSGRFGCLGDCRNAIALVVSLSPKIKYDFTTYRMVDISWDKLRKSRYRGRFEAKVGSLNSALPIRRILDESIVAWPSSEALPDAIFVAEIDMVPAKEPETLIAKIWQECLGENAIPFDPVERQKLIEHGRQHSELRRHIEHWEKAKDSDPSSG